MRLLILSALILCSSSELRAQISPNKSPDSVLLFLSNNKNLDRLNSYYDGLNNRIVSSASRTIDQFQKQERKIKSIVEKNDSSRASLLFIQSDASVRELYTRLKNGTSNPVNTLSNYVPGIDSIQTALKYLSTLPGANVSQIQNSLAKICALQKNLQVSNDIETYIRERTTLFKDQLSNYLSKGQLSNLSRYQYYYKEQLQNYRNILHDQQKQQQLILAGLSHIPAFAEFWKGNSISSKLFPSSPTQGTLAAAADLQTRNQIGAIIEQRLGENKHDSGAAANKYLQKQQASAQVQVSNLSPKLQLIHLPLSDNEGLTMPDFKPNGQKGKTLLGRLEYGFILQNLPATTVLPATSTIGLSLGYKINDRATAGVGGSYMFGLGQDFNHIRFSNQGIGFRSFLDIKAKGSFWLTGGYEVNYYQAFKNLSIIRNVQTWQSGALIGVMKKYNVGKRTGNFQLLYDVLAQTQVPRVSPFKLRFGFGL